MIQNFGQTYFPWKFYYILCAVSSISYKKMLQDFMKWFIVLLAYTIKVFSACHSFDFAEKMISRIEKKRWESWEQPILLLSIILHPSYKLSKFKPMVNNLTWTHVGQLLKYY